MNAFLKLAGTAALTVAAISARGANTDDPLAPWRAAIKIAPVSNEPGRHTIHTYYLTCPESPDGSRVLFYASTKSDGHQGDLIVRERATGQETIIARGIDTEDAHRAACQQWISGGKRVAYHDVKDGRWSVHVVELDTRRDRVLALDRQLCFGPPSGDVVPIYGCHWNPGEHRDLELLNVGSGEIRTAVTISEVEKDYGAYLTQQFGGRPTSIFFPNISPDGRKVFFKMSAGAGGDNFRSKGASQRQGLFVYDLSASKFVFMSPKWGHPAWHPDSAKIIEAGNYFFDIAAGGKMIRMPDLPKMRGNHPSVSPDGRLFVMDGFLEETREPDGLWGVAVCDVRGKQSQVIHRFDNSRGAKSWRKNHPHPIFSADGQRIYFNVNEADWTQMLMADCGGEYRQGARAAVSELNAEGDR